MFVRPEEVIKNFELRPGMTVADFGSGSGHYVLTVADKIAFKGVIGKSGVVYAVDIQKNLLEAIKSEANKRHLNNVEIIWADLEGQNGSHLATGTIDFVIASNIFFQLGNREALTKEIFRVLKKGGRVGLIDWITIPKPTTVVGFNKQEAERMFLQEGFVEEKEFSAGDNHYGIIFKKP